MVEQKENEMHLSWLTSELQLSLTGLQQQSTVSMTFAYIEIWKSQWDDNIQEFITVEFLL